MSEELKDEGLKDEVTLMKASMNKVIRSRVRLRHSIAADFELNVVLKQFEEAFDKAIAAGEPYELDSGYAVEAPE